MEGIKKNKSKLFYSVDKCQRVNSLFHSVYRSISTDCKCVLFWIVQHL